MYLFDLVSFVGEEMAIVVVFLRYFTCGISLSREFVLFHFPNQKIQISWYIRENSKHVYLLILLFFSSTNVNEFMHILSGFELVLVNILCNFYIGYDHLFIVADRSEFNKLFVKSL